MRRILFSVSVCDLSWKFGFLVHGLLVSPPGALEAFVTVNY